MKNKRGFTLIELLIALLIFGVLMMVAIPNFKHMFHRFEADQTIHALYRGIQFAKSRAIKKDMMIALCGSKDQKYCDDDWSEGFIIFTDKEQSGQLLSVKDILLGELFKKSGSLSWQNFRKKAYLQITPLGFTHSQNGRFIYCPNDSAIKGQALVITKTGRLRIENQNC